MYVHTHLKERASARARAASERRCVCTYTPQYIHTSKTGCSKCMALIFCNFFLYVHTHLSTYTPQRLGIVNVPFPQKSGTDFLNFFLYVHTHLSIFFFCMYIHTSVHTHLKDWVLLPHLTAPECCIVPSLERERESARECMYVRI